MEMIARNNRSIRNVRKPYFSNNIGLTPPNSSICKIREKHRSLDFYSVKSKLFKAYCENTFDKLKDAISRQIYQIESLRLKSCQDRRSMEELYALESLPTQGLLKRCDSKMIEKIDWMTISCTGMNGSMSHEHCRRLCENFLSTTFSHSTWTNSENRELLKLTSKIGTEGRWVEVASQMSQKRHPVTCYRQWQQLTSKTRSVNEWSSEEDESLWKLVQGMKQRNLKRINWNLISLEQPNKSATDCQLRYDVIEPIFLKRNFTDDEDYRLLVNIRRIGIENWDAISQEMNQCPIFQCKDRFCQLVDKFSPWTYLEDRRLWMSLKPYFRQLWTESTPFLNATEDLNLYKSIIHQFYGRNSVVIRYRYRKLCKWFSEWHHFFFPGKTTEEDNRIHGLLLLEELQEERKSIADKIGETLMHSEYFDTVHEALISMGSINPDQGTKEILNTSDPEKSTLCDDLLKSSNDNKLKNVLLFTKDVRAGIFIPWRLRDFIEHSTPKTMDLRSLISDINCYDSKIAFGRAIRKELRIILNSGFVNDIGNRYITKLIESEGQFISAFRHATSMLKKKEGLSFHAYLSTLISVLPIAIKYMINYIYSEDQRKLTQKKGSKNIDIKNSAKCRHIAQLLIHRSLIPTIYKTYLSPEEISGGLAINGLPLKVHQSIIKKNNQEICSMNIRKRLADVLKYPGLEHTDTVPRIGPLTPFTLTCSFMRSLYLQRENLLANGKNKFIDFFRNRYRKTLTPVNHLKDRRFLILKSRMLSLLSLPSVATRISTLNCALSGDKLHESQNGVPASTAVSSAYGSAKRPCDEDMPLLRKVSHRVSKHNFLDNYYSSLSRAKPPSKHVNIYRHMLRRRTGKFWIDLVAPESDRSFFVSKASRRWCLKKGFEVETINGVAVKDFMEQ